MLKRGDLITGSKMTDPATEFEHALIRLDTKRIQNMLNVSAVTGVHVKYARYVFRLQLGFAEHVQGKRGAGIVQ
jgi:hypothetical protein